MQSDKIKRCRASNYNKRRKEVSFTAAAKEGKHSNDSHWREQQEQSVVAMTKTKKISVNTGFEKQTFVQLWYLTNESLKLQKSDNYFNFKILTI